MTDYIPKEQLKDLIQQVQDSYRESNNVRLPQTKMSKDLGYNPNHISRILAENGVISEDFVTAFNSKYSEILNTNNIQPPPPPMNIKRYADIQLDVDTNLKALPEPYSGAVYLYRFNGDSMYPKIPGGAELAVKEIKDFSVIISGEIYLIHLKNGLTTVRYINLVEDSPEDLILAPYNKQAGITKVKRKEITHLFKIQFILTRI